MFNPISDLDVLETVSKCPMLTECPFRAEQCQEDEDCSPDAVCCKSPCGKVCTKQLFTGKFYHGQSNDVTTTTNVNKRGWFVSNKLGTRSSLVEQDEVRITRGVSRINLLKDESYHQTWVVEQR